MKLFFKITEIETLINIIYTVRSSSLNRCFCVFLLTVLMIKLNAMGAVSLPNLLRLYMLRKPDVTSLVLCTFFVEEVVLFYTVVNC